MSQLSVVVCTHNPRQDYLCRSLEALRHQNLPTTEWELLVVDNASADPVAPALDLRWHPRARVIREETLGVLHARLRGMKETAEPLILFVDDDNLLCEDYLSAALQICETHPFLGAFGAGVIVPEFETPPPAWTEPYLGLLAIRSQEHDLWSNDLEANRARPYTAGGCLRRPLAEAFIRRVTSDPRHLRLGQKGNNLTRCEDDDIALTAVEMGLGYGIFSRLRVTHLIPKARLEESYLLRLQSGMAESHALLYYLWHDKPPGLATQKPDWWRQSIKAVLGVETHSDRFRDAHLRGHERALELIDTFEKEKR